MDNFPSFIRSPLNKVDSKYIHTKGAEGYLFDEADGSQCALWICNRDEFSEEHSHEFDEYLVVVEGVYTLIIDGREILLTPGKEFYIPKGTAHSGKVEADSRIILITNFAQPLSQYRDSFEC